ncbi:MAG: glyoxalase [Myxococcales bacterium]|nr:glyoxalase [Myxococcales bacterium]
MGTSITGLGYLGIQSPRAEQWNEYGPKVLGLQLAERDGGGVVRLRVDDRAHRLAIHYGEPEGFAYAGWELPHAEAFAEVVERVERVGIATSAATPTELALRRVRAMVHFRDPDGFRHELFYGQEGKALSFHPGRPHRGFVTGDHGLGHLAIGVRNLEATRRFYLDVLGFSVTDEMDAHFRILFFHTNPRHHSIAAVEVPNPGLFHLMLEARSLDDVGFALDHCEELGVPIRRTLGRHPNDRTVSCYLGTPSGFDIECGWGSIDVVPGENVTTVEKMASMWGHKQLTPSSCLPPI